MNARRDVVGVLAINVGTPDAPSPRAVRAYLRDFLSDPRVVDLHPLARWLLLNLVILPFRPRRSAEAYRAIWGPSGSPLLRHSAEFAEALARRLGPGFEVRVGMRYGRPSLLGAVDRLAAACGRIVVFPLFPQYASSTTGTALEAVYQRVSTRPNVNPLVVVPPFHRDPGFLRALATVAAETLKDATPDHVLMSFHGLPERHVRKSDETRARCLKSAGCCDTLDSANRWCYRAQSFATARDLAGELGLTDGAWSVAFQSRLGRDPWIGPATDVRIAELARGGVRRLAVVCPSFVADCLETLEEIGIRAARAFRNAGGETLTLVPGLNAAPEWVDAAGELVRAALGRGRAPSGS